ncbi:MAG: putative zinc-binding protein [bacterium]
MAEDKSEKCICEGGVVLIFACSGAADVGAVADRAARMLSANGIGNMYCLAGVGGKVSGIVASTKAASRIIVIDGCHLDCARKTLEQIEINDLVHIRVTDLGFQKDKTPVTDETINKVKEEVLQRYGGELTAT